MKSASTCSVMGMAFFALGLFAHSAETNVTPAKALPAQKILGMGGIVTTAPERKVSPPFTGKELPSPPEQLAFWNTPKSNLPTNYVSATELLFEQGMADPRGCEYREIEIGTGDVWRGDGGLVRTHGWILPDTASQKFAVCWNGMVYPVVTVGTNADLDADVALMETNQFNSWQSALPEALVVSPGYPQGVRGCLLLRLGRTDLAIRLWLALEQRQNHQRNAMMRQIAQTNEIVDASQIKLSSADPYLGWANDWAWAMFDRLICAHQRGDEKLALFTARLLATAQPQIETAGAARGFKRQPSWDSRREKELQPYLGFLNQLPAILTDLERREAEGPRVSILTTGITNIADQSRRIAALIRDLDMVAARQWGQPGWVSPSDDAVVSALIAEGDAAVEPLLDCLEQDRRLTRSVGFGRDFHRGRTVLPVSKCADHALQSILLTSFANSAAMRAYWNKYKDLKLPERWYAILQDEAARTRWIEAANNIVQPENVTSYPNGVTLTRPIPTNAPVSIRGEILRSKSDPTVTELLVRHALETPAEDTGNYDLAAACQFADCLARWDSAAALPVAKKLSKRVATVMKYSGGQLGGQLTRLALARADQGDAQAFDEYAAWISTTTPDQLGYQIGQQLEPLKRFPTNAVLIAAAEKMFTDNGSPWGQFPWKNTSSREMFDPKLFSLPPFRILLARELAKTNHFGSLTWRGNNFLEYQSTNSSGGMMYLFTENQPQTNAVVADLRWCDWIAIQFASTERIPFFNPFTPAAERDLKLSKIRARLVQNDFPAGK